MKKSVILTLFAILFATLIVFARTSKNVQDQQACDYARKKGTVEVWQDYLRQFPQGMCAFEAESEIKDLNKRPQNKELQWSKRSGKMKWSAAKSYCSNLTEGGYSDWRLPNIDELRTLLIADRVSNRCQLSERNNCLSLECWSCSTCTQAGTEDPNDKHKYCSIGGWGSDYSDGRYSRLGDGAIILWSSSGVSGEKYYKWYVDFECGVVASNHTGNDHYVRCVR
jgi:hypothetical protein